MTAPSQEAIQAAGECYGAILADPERAEQLRRARAKRRHGLHPATRRLAEHAARTGDLRITNNPE